ncbi:hypothetical protein [Marininema mesophilum]|uniref:hypothetical protein n=1 Tax=Marininema mesophilum TaxID=1048340 RepID=UPI00115FAFA0|nr:hypothetical protein [Marininema mesophilum]
MMKPIRCIECYRQRPGGRCDFCPLHRKNRPLYESIGDGWYVRKEEKKPGNQHDSPDTQSESS